jgi:hypothetical protein
VAVTQLQQDALKAWAVDEMCLVNHDNDACGNDDPRKCYAAENAIEVLDSLAAYRTALEQIAALVHDSPHDELSVNWCRTCIAEKALRG